MEIFRAALQDMSTDGKTWREPQSFREYCEHLGIVARTQSSISIQTGADLPKELVESNTMVLRLGGPGPTKFGLVAADRDVISEFFLSDIDCFDREHTELFLPEADLSTLLPFQILGSIEESGALNLALASGLLGHALNLDKPYPRIAPARGQSTYTFQFKPHAARPVEWRHEKGQVEIDTVVLAKRGGRSLLFVVEAKHGRLGPGLAKHKLAYPVYAMMNKPLPAEIEIVPVYLRSWADGQYLNFAIAECRFEDEASRSLTSLNPIRRTKVVTLPFGFLS